MRLSQLFEHLLCVRNYIQHCIHFSPNSASPLDGSHIVFVVQMGKARLEYCAICLTSPNKISNLLFILLVTTALWFSFSTSPVVLKSYFPTKTWASPLQGLYCCPRNVTFKDKTLLFLCPDGRRSPWKQRFGGLGFVAQYRHGVCAWKMEGLRSVGTQLISEYLTGYLTGYFISGSFF